MSMNTPSDELVTYIRNGLAAGQTPDAIRSALKAAGWADADVEAAFGQPVAPGAKEKKKFFAEAGDRRHRYCGFCSGSAWPLILSF